MCGIVGYVGPREATDFLLEGLCRLEYRGYDSSGVATITPAGRIGLAKSAGRIERLSNRLMDAPLAGKIGIGHTRWATHGPPNDENAHPHLGGNDVVAIAHNGVIENYQQLKERLVAEGFRFRSATDSEVIAHLIASRLETLRAEGQAATGSGGKYAHLLAAVEWSLAHLQGTYGLVVLFREHPEVLIAARLGSPLVVGVGHGEHFIASDASPLVGHTDKIVYLADHEVALVTANALRVIHRDQGHIQHSVHVLDWEAGDVDLRGYPHYMLKEIHEQPETIRNTMR